MFLHAPTHFYSHFRTTQVFVLQVSAQVPNKFEVNLKDQISNFIHECCMPNKVSPGHLREQLNLLKNSVFKHRQLQKGFQNTIFNLMWLSVVSQTVKWFSKCSRTTSLLVLSQVPACNGYTWPFLLRYTRKKFPLLNVVRILFACSSSLSVVSIQRHCFIYQPLFPILDLLSLRACTLFHCQCFYAFFFF